MSDNYVGLDNELEWRREQMSRNWPRNQHGSLLTQGEWDAAQAELASLRGVPPLEPSQEAVSQLKELANSIAVAANFRYSLKGEALDAFLAMSDRLKKLADGLRAVPSRDLSLAYAAFRDGPSVKSANDLLGVVLDMVTDTILDGDPSGRGDTPPMRSMKEFNQRYLPEQAKQDRWDDMARPDAE